jgi:hypothetical protein
MTAVRQPQVPSLAWQVMDDITVHMYINVDELKSKNIQYCNIRCSIDVESFKLTSTWEQIFL